MEKDKNLLGNKLIEDAISDMYKNMSDERLAKVLTTIRSRMMDGGHLVVAVKPSETEGLELRPVRLQDGTKWFAAFTSMDEEIKRQDTFISGFTAEISMLFNTALQVDEVSGIIINPWDKALKLDKQLIRLLGSDPNFVTS